MMSTNNESSHCYTQIETVYSTALGKKLLCAVVFSSVLHDASLLHLPKRFCSPYEALCCRTGHERSIFQALRA